MRSIQAAFGRLHLNLPADKEDDPGETRLQAIKFELERQGLSRSSFYNADGILIDTSCDMELALLETTGPFGLKNITRVTTDHVKAAHGMMTMLHGLAYSYIYADADIFFKLKVYFIHAYDKKIRLRSFGLVSKELYIFRRIRSEVLPVNHVDSEEEIKGITNMMWKDYFNHQDI
ncbi:hypothetical protein BD770DRAFT_380965 [Pilaira anomala]|nr:hypothetical protein BD770DRAFT_380965 [Pilaira anomala]